MLVEIFNPKRNNGKGGFEVTMPAVVKSVNLATKVQREGSTKTFYRGQVVLTKLDGTQQVVPANVNVGAYESNPDAFEPGVDIGFTIPTRETGKNAGRGGWMSFVRPAAVNFDEYEAITKAADPTAAAPAETV